MKKTSILIIVASLLAAVTSVKADPYRRPVVRPVRCCDAHYRGHWAAGLWIWDAPLAPVVTVAPPVVAVALQFAPLPLPLWHCRPASRRAGFRFAELRFTEQPWFLDMPTWICMEIGGLKRPARRRMPCSTKNSILKPQGRKGRFPARQHDYAAPQLLHPPRTG